MDQLTTLALLAVIAVVGALVKQDSVVGAIQIARWLVRLGCRCQSSDERQFTDPLADFEHAVVQVRAGERSIIWLVLQSVHFAGAEGVRWLARALVPSLGDDPVLDLGVAASTIAPTPAGPVALRPSRVIHATGVRLADGRPVTHQFAACCRARPGEPIHGFGRPDGIVMVHESRCEMADALARHPGRERVRLTWEAAAAAFELALSVIPDVEIEVALRTCIARCSTRGATTMVLRVDDQDPARLIVSLSCTANEISSVARVFEGRAYAPELDGIAFQSVQQVAMIGTWRWQLDKYGAFAWVLPRPE